MKISTKGRYAVTALFDLAKNYESGRPVSASEISERQGISFDYLEQLFSRLRRSGLIKSVRGPKGGYVLAKSPSKIKIGDIVRVSEGPIALVDCLISKDQCVKSGCCATKGVWKLLTDKVTEVLDSLTLADLLIKTRRVQHG